MQGDEGYSGQYLGPVENVNTRKRNNIEDVNSAPHHINENWFDF